MVRIVIIGLVVLLYAHTHAQQITSPDGNISLQFELTAQGGLQYSLKYHSKDVILTSQLGLELKDADDFMHGFEVLTVDETSHDDTWNPVWGEMKEIRNHYNELSIKLVQPENERIMVVTFRVFNDGLGFRYEFPLQDKLNYFIVADEKTTFNLTGDHKAFWIPGDYDTNEYPYNTSTLSTIDADVATTETVISTRWPIGKNFVQTPLMLKTADNLYINIHEAGLLDYSAMHLEVDQENFVLSSHLTPDAYDNKAYVQTPFTTPWRTVVVSLQAEDILASKLILNLNEPSVLEDTDWIKPVKYIGIWWDMHVGLGSWNYSDSVSTKLSVTDWNSLKPNGRHRATTERTKYCIDFAAEHGFDGVLIEGWNIGWEDWFGYWKEEVFDFVTPNPDFDAAELGRYAKSKNVGLIMHHETSSSVTNYERRLDDAVAFMNEHGYGAVKTGYVGKIIPRGEFHDGQWMVNHYTRVAKKLADNQILLDAHEPVRPTGLHRTYPNWLTSEAARGNEFNAWSAGSPPEHETILPFTRLMGGPMDYTPGIFEVKMSHYTPGNEHQVQTTLVKQLALFITMYSPLQMAADIPENYEKRMDAFQFLKDAPVDWDDTKIMDAEPGDYICMARLGKGTRNWFLGAITDENGRTLNAPLIFLDEGYYTLTLYSDAPDAHWKDNPTAYVINQYRVSAKTVLKLRLAPGGGAAAAIRPYRKEDGKLKRYR